VEVKMIQVTKNVYVESDLMVCNLGLVTTKEGIVMIDTPVRPTDAVKWRDEISKKGDLKYVINTEDHGDHCWHSWLFPGVLITSHETRERLAKVPAGEVIERIKALDPDGSPLMEGFQLRLADITFTGSLDLYLGDHTFRLFHLPGHTTAGIGAYIPEERVVFATDIVFHQVKTWLQEANPDQWLESLNKLGEMDIDFIVPGHGDICKKDYLEKQAGIIRRWVEAIQSAIEEGLSEEEAVTNISQPDPYPKQPNTPSTEPELNRRIITHLYHLYSKKV